MLSQTAAAAEISNNTWHRSHGRGSSSCHSRHIPRLTVQMSEMTLRGDKFEIQYVLR
jgi:hypothetical protein